MSDLKSELMKLSNLKFDDEGEPETPTVVEQPTMTHTSERERVWNYIKTHPQTSANAIALGLGISKAHSASQVFALFKRGIVTRSTVDDTYAFTAVGEAYPRFDPVAHGKIIGAASAGRPRVSKKARGAYKVDPLKHKRNAEQAKLLEAELPTGVSPLPPGLRFHATFDQLLDTMSVLQARELYDKLKTIFGG